MSKIKKAIRQEGRKISYVDLTKEIVPSEMIKLAGARAIEIIPSKKLGGFVFISKKHNLIHTIYASRNDVIYNYRGKLYALEAKEFYKKYKESKRDRTKG